MEHEFERAGRTAVLMDPHPLCHTALAALLARFDTKVAATATSAAAARVLIELHRPDLVLAEVDLPEGREEGLSIVALAQADPSLTVIVLSTSDDPELMRAAFEAGASAYISKTAEPGEIAAAVRQTFAPNGYLAQANGRTATVTVTAFPQDRVRPRLTRREVEILRLVSEGRSNREAGQVLWVTDQTVKFHLANIYRKLGVRNRHEAAQWARAHGLLDLAVSGELVSVGDGNVHGNGNSTGTASGGRLTRLTPRYATPPVAFREPLEGTSR
jgi:DNA-binding NarL/FixJ family response regulator